MKQILLIVLLFPLVVLAQNRAAQPIQNFPDLILQNQKIIAKETPRERRDRHMFRLAQSYLSMSRYEKAIPILEDLVRRHPENRSYYQTLLRAYMTISDIAAADSLVQQMLQRNPGDLLLEVDRAMVLYRENRKDEAIAIWNSVLERRPKDPGMYNRVANAMLQNRLLDEAIRVYQLGLERIPHSDYFLQNIASLYQSRLMYARAAEYYLKYLERNPSQQQYIFNRILSFRVMEDDRDAFYQALENFARHSSIPNKVYLLMAQLYQRDREFEKAYRIYRRLEQVKGDGSYLLRFARAARQDSSYQIALKAYREVIQKQQAGGKVPIEAYEGAVLCLYQLAGQTRQAHYAREAVEMIEKIRSRESDWRRLARLIYLEGQIYLDYYFDVDKAMTVFREVVQHGKREPRFAARARLKLGECYLIRGELKKALREFQQLQHTRERAMGLLRQAETYYYLKDWENTRKAVNEILHSEGLESEVTNDALALQMKMDRLRSQPDILEQFAEADLLMFQRKKSEALRRYTNLLKTSQLPSSLRAEIYQKVVQLNVELKEIPTALEWCTRALNDSTQLLYADRHLFLMAEILEKQAHRPRDAFKAYQTLLQNYPNSLFVEQARERLKALRTKIEEEIP